MAEKRKTPWYAWVVLILVIVLGVPMCLGYFRSAEQSSGTRQTSAPDTSLEPEAPAAPAPAQEEKLLQTFEGTDRHTTRPFTVPDKWEIRWRISGDGYNGITLYRADGSRPDLVANSTKATEGTKFIPAGGEFYLEITPSGPWKVEVWQVP